MRVMLLIQNMFPVAFISPKNWINCHRELRINLITTRASFQSTEKHTFNDFPLGTNVTHGKYRFFTIFLRFLSGSLKAIHSPGTESRFYSKNCCGNSHAVVLDSFFQRGKLWDQNLRVKKSNYSVE